MYSICVFVPNPAILSDLHDGIVCLCLQSACCISPQISFLMNLAIASYEEGWRVSLGVQCLLAVILIVGMLFLPETPR